MTPPQSQDPLLVHAGPRAGGSRFAHRGNPANKAVYPVRVPNQPKTPLQLHSFRVTDEIWEAAKERAEERGETLADVLRAALARYLTE